MKLLMLADAGSAHTLRWVGALAARGHEIRLFTLTPPPRDAYDRIAGVSVAWQGFDDTVARDAEGALGKLRYLRALPLLAREIRRWRPDLVHAHYASSYGLLATLVRARPRIVSVWGMDVYSFPQRSFVHRLLMKAILDSADAVLSTSHVMRRHVASLTDRPVDVTAFGVDTRRFCPLPRPDTESGLCVGTVKSLEVKYGIEYLLRAYAICLSDGVRPGACQLVIVGDGSLRSSLERLAVELGIADSVRFVGAKPYDEVHGWHQGFDLAVYPSIDDSESFGVAAVESQSCGVPVVVSRVGGLPEVVVEGRTGLVVPPRDPQALAAAILGILRDRETRLEMGESARRHAVDAYSLETCTATMEGIYARVVGGAIDGTGAGGPGPSH